MEEKNTEIVAAWTIAQFKQSIENSSDESFLILTDDYQLLVIAEEDVPKYIKDKGPK